MNFGKIIGLGALVLSLGPTAATVLLADGGDATLVHACVAKDGTMRVVSASTACKTNESALHWATSTRIVTDETRITNTENKNTTQDSQISAIQTKNTQQDQQIVSLQGQSGGAVVVKDIQGQVVGKFLSPTGLGWNGVLAENGRLLLSVNFSGFVLNVQPTIYSGSDCTGTGYMLSLIATQPDSYITEVAGFDGQLFKYPSLTGPYLAFTPASYSAGIPNECVNSDPGYGPIAKFAEVQTLNVSTLGFVPPFHLE